MLQDFVKTVTEFAQTHQDLLLPMIFVIAFLECLAFVSILAPATVLFTALGTDRGAAGIGLVPLALTATVGSVLGYWVSYWLGLCLGPPCCSAGPSTAAGARREDAQLLRALGRDRHPHLPFLGAGPAARAAWSPAS
jgi:membrane protein DedA with SNARE-associated domain